MNSGTYYLKFFNPATQRYKEAEDFFSFSKFYNANEKPLYELYQNPNDAFQAGLLTSGQATGLGLQVITTGVGDQKVTQVLYGEDYTLPTNDISFTPFSLKEGCINGISYIKVALTGTSTPTGDAPITGYYIAIDLNPLPGSCE